MRIAVTGIGAVSAVGVGCGALDRALRSGASGIGPVTLFDTSDQKTHLGAEVRDLRPRDHLPARMTRHASRSDVLGMIAAREAIEAAGLAGTADVGVWVGATVGGMLSSELWLARAATHADRPLPFDAMVAHPLSSTADRVARLLGLKGPRATVCTACSSGAHALALARRALEQGRCRAALAGGADSLCRMTYTGFNALGAVDPAPCRPFDRARAGLSLGEAGAFLVLEPLDRARARGAPVWAELVGFGACSEAHHITNPLETGAGAARAMGAALHDAGIGAERIDYVNAHGTGTRLNDAMEARALGEVLGARARVVPVSSSKGQLGHTLGAAGAIEAVVTVLAIRGGYAPPTAGLDQPDPDCALDLVRGPARPCRVLVALSSSFGFGGNDAAVVLAAPDAVDRPARAARAVVVTGAATCAPASPGPLPSEAVRSLDPARARRLDGLSRLGCVIVGAALEDAGYSGADAGVALGTAFGAVDESTTFMARTLDKGPRLAPPADFPNLVLSAPAAHASIYHRLEGQHVTIAALGASGEAALAAGFDQVRDGSLRACAAGGAERSVTMRERVFGDRATSAGGGRAHPSEGAAALVLESAEDARARGASVRARFAGWSAAADPLDGCGDPIARTARAIDDALARSGVVAAAVRHVLSAHDRAVVEAAAARALGPARPAIEILSERRGWHEALGAEAACVAVELVHAQGGAALVIGLAPGQSFCLVFLEAAAP